MIDLDIVVAHLRLDDDELEQNSAYLNHLIAAALDSFEAQTNRVLCAADTELPTPIDNAVVINHRIIQGALLLIGQWYANRENVVVGVSVAHLPAATESLWAPYRWMNL